MHKQCNNVDNFLSTPIFSKNNFSDILYGMEKFRKLKKVKRQRKHGFLSRIAKRGGQLVLKRRRAKGRIRLSI